MRPPRARRATCSVGTAYSDDLVDTVDAPATGFDEWAAIVEALVWIEGGAVAAVAGGAPLILDDRLGTEYLLFQRPFGRSSPPMTEPILRAATPGWAAEQRGRAAASAPRIGPVPRIGPWSDDEPLSGTVPSYSRARRVEGAGGADGRIAQSSGRFPREAWFEGPPVPDRPRRQSRSRAGRGGG